MSTTTKPSEAALKAAADVQSEWWLSGKRDGPDKDALARVIDGALLSERTGWALAVASLLECADAEMSDGHACECVGKADDDYGDPPPCAYCMARDALAGGTLIDSALSDERARAARMEEALKDLLRHCEDYWSAGSEDFDGFDPNAKKPHPYAKAARAALGKGGA